MGAHIWCRAILRMVHTWYDKPKGRKEQKVEEGRGERRKPEARLTTPRLCVELQARRTFCVLLRLTPQAYRTAPRWDVRRNSRDAGVGLRERDQVGNPLCCPPLNVRGNRLRLTPTRCPPTADSEWVCGAGILTEAYNLQWGAVD